MTEFDGVPIRLTGPFSIRLPKAESCTMLASVLARLFQAQLFQAQRIGDLE